MNVIATVLLDTGLEWRIMAVTIIDGLYGEGQNMGVITNRK